MTSVSGRILSQLSIFVTDKHRQEFRLQWRRMPPLTASNCDGAHRDLVGLPVPLAEQCLGLPTT